jgi:hypothetical protein
MAYCEKNDQCGSGNCEIGSYLHCSGWKKTGEFLGEAIYVPDCKWKKNSSGACSL